MKFSAFARVHPLTVVVRLQSSCGFSCILFLFSFLGGRLIYVIRVSLISFAGPKFLQIWRFFLCENILQPCVENPHSTGEGLVGPWWTGGMTVQMHCVKGQVMRYKQACLLVPRCWRDICNRCRWAWWNYRTRIAQGLPFVRNCILVHLVATSITEEG